MTPPPLTVLDYLAMGVGYGVMIACGFLLIAMGVSRATRRANRRGG